MIMVVNADISLLVRPATQWMARLGVKLYLVSEVRIGVELKERCSMGIQPRLGSSIGARTNTV